MTFIMLKHIVHFVEGDIEYFHFSKTIVNRGALVDNDF